MNFRVVSIAVASLICLVSLAGVLAQRRQLAALRTEQVGLRVQREARDQNSLDSTAPARLVENAANPIASPSLELLRMRAEVARLTNRRRELTGVDKENERLRTQLAASRTNRNAAVELPSGYIRKSTARFLGYTTPEATLESFLWALQNRDFTNVMQALTPQMADRLQAQAAQSGRSHEDFFKEVGVLPGIRIVGRQPGHEPDSYELNLEIIPGTPAQTTVFWLTNGLWKMEMP